VAAALTFRKIKNHFRLYKQSRNRPVAHGEPSLDGTKVERVIRVVEELGADPS